MVITTIFIINIIMIFIIVFILIFIITITLIIIIMIIIMIRPRVPRLAIRGPTIATLRSFPTPIDAQTKVMRSGPWRAGNVGN